MTSLAAAAEGREAGPIGLVVVLCLLVALIFLIRSMNKHLRKVPAGFAARDADPTAPTAAPTTAAAVPDGPDADPDRADPTP